MTSWKVGTTKVRGRVLEVFCEPSRCLSSCPGSRRSPSTGRPPPPAKPSSSGQSWGRVACWSHSKHWPSVGSAALKDREKLVLHPILHLRFFSASDFCASLYDACRLQLYLYQGAVEKVWSHQGFPPPRASSSRCKIFSQIAVSQLWIHLHGMDTILKRRLHTCRWPPWCAPCCWAWWTCTWSPPRWPLFHPPRIPGWCRSQGWGKMKNKLDLICHRESKSKFICVTLSWTIFLFWHRRALYQFASTMKQTAKGNGLSWFIGMTLDLLWLWSVLVIYRVF